MKNIIKIFSILIILNLVFMPVVFAKGGHGGGHSSHSSSHSFSSVKSSSTKTTISGAKTGAYTSKIKTSKNGTTKTYSKTNYKSTVPSYGTTNYHASDWVSPNVWTILYLCSSHHSNAVAAGTDENKEVIESADDLEAKMNALGLSDAEKETVLAAIETGILDDEDISMDKVIEKLDAQNQEVINEEKISNFLGWFIIILLIIAVITIIIIVVIY